MKKIERIDIDIEQYISDYEKRKITATQIAALEGVSITTINNRIDEYYMERKKERPKFARSVSKTINIEKYISDYENGKITVQEIAEREDLCISSTNAKINEYYLKRKKKRPRVREEKTKINIEQYISDYEKGIIMVDEIAKLEGISHSVANAQINKYYKRMGKKRPQIGAPIEVLAYYLKKGMTRDEIRKVAKKRNILIPDSFFENAEEKLKLSDRAK